MKNIPTDVNKINLVEIPQEQLEKERNPNYEYFSIDEPKQENCCTPEGQIKRYVDCKGCDRKPKQETPEEAAKEYIIKKYQKGTYLGKLFIAGAKWQEERMYSEEDMRTAFFSAIKITGEGWNGEYANGNNPNVESKFNSDYIEWFEQFKK